jgi:hypothetical protein
VSMRPLMCAARASRLESAAVVVPRRGKNASARSSSVRRRAICRRSQREALGVRVGLASDTP